MMKESEQVYLRRILEISLMSESSLKKDWLTIEEDNAWADL